MSSTTRSDTKHRIERGVHRELLSIPGVATFLLVGHDGRVLMRSTVDERAMTGDLVSGLFMLLELCDPWPVPTVIPGGRAAHGSAPRTRAASKRPALAVLP